MSKKLLLTVGALIAIAAGGVIWLQSDESPAPVTGSGLASCPATREVEWRPMAATRQGELVPQHATKGLLCVYPFPAGGTTTATLSDAHTVTQEADDVIAYLNGLPAKVDTNLICLTPGQTEYTMVFEYADGHAVVPVGCGVEYAGATRPEVNLKKLLGFWHVSA